MYPDVDVVIPTLNSEKLLDKCLKGIRSQNYGGRINIIIMDGGSTDNTIDIAKRYDCEIHIFKGMFSTGLTGARNQALKYCNGQLYWQIDSDNIILDPNVLTKLVEPFLKIEDCQIVIPMIGILNEQSGIDKWFAKYEEYRIKEMCKGGTNIGNWVIIDDMSYGITNASLIRRSLIEKVGGYDSDVRVLKRARNKKLSKGVVVKDAYYYHFTGENPIKWLKKLIKRIRFFSKFTDEQLMSYFVQESYDHSYQKDEINSSLLFIKYSFKMLKEKEPYFFYGFIILFLYLIVLIGHPKDFINTYRRFL